MRALVVVDDASLQSDIADFFGRRQLAVQICPASRPAVDAVEQHHFPFVIVDLAVDSALDVCRAVRRREDGERTYILAALPQATAGALRDALEAGIDDYVTRPLSIKTLQLRMAIAERNLARRLRVISAEEQQSGAERRYRTLVQTMNEGLFLVDDAGRIEFANTRMSSFTGYTVDELIGQSADELLVDNEFRARLPGQTLLGSGVGSEEYTLPLRRKDGGHIWVKLVGTPTVTAENRPGSMGIVQDLTEQRKAEEGLRHREEYFRALLDNSSDLISIIGLDGQVLYQSPSSENMLGVPPELIAGTDILDFVHPEDRPAFKKALDQALADDDLTPSVEVRLRHQSGEWLYVESLCVDLVDNPVLGGVVVTSRDITERRRVEAALKRERAFFQQLFRNSPTGIVILDTSDRVVEANRSFTDLFQFDVEELAGRPLLETIVPADLHQEAAELSQAVEQGQNVERETLRQRKDGSDVDVSIVCYPIEVGGRRIGAYGIYSNITERKKAERQLFHEAFHDSLTGLPNRSLLAERLERSLRRARRREDYQFALLFIDLDRFKVINDSLGHAAGDELLVEMARRLGSCLRPGDTVARLGGDEFNIILDDIKEPSDATRVTERILESLARPFTVADQEVTSSGSIGIAFSSSGYHSADDVMRDADIAMYRAKSAGKARYEIFDIDMHKTAVERLKLENELRQALDSESFELFYQPVISLAQQTLVGFEALVRWHHPERGLLRPEHWLATCEETGLITAIGRFTLAAACLQLAAWQSEFPELDAASVSLNLSLKELEQADFLDELDAAASASGIHTASMTLELGEAVLQNASSQTVDRLWHLRERGFRLAIHDFGTGFSSLSSLHRLPIDSLKIDRSFVREMKPGGENLEIVRAVVALGESLGLTVVAAGVENASQLEQLRRLGVTFVQGNYFSPAVPAEQARAFILQPPTW